MDISPTVASRTSRDVRLESASRANEDIDQIAVMNRDFMSTRPNLIDHGIQRIALTDQQTRPCGRIAERVMEYLAGAEDHSGLMLAARITLAHFSVSSAMNLAKSAVAIVIG